MAKIARNGGVGRPRDPDRERYANGRAKQVAPPSAMLLARRAALINPDAVQRVLDNADTIKREARRKAADRKEALSRPGEEAAVIDAVAECVGLNADTRIETALGRYYVTRLLVRDKQHQEVSERKALYTAGVIYAAIHGSVWAGARDDITRAFNGPDGAGEHDEPELQIVVSQTRRLRSHLAAHVASELAVDLDPEPDRTPEEQEENRRRLWARYRAAREVLERLGRPVLRAVDELVIEDRDPWWLAPRALPVVTPSEEAIALEPEERRAALRRQREERIELRDKTERLRLGHAARERDKLHRGLDALADLFGTKDRKPIPETAATMVTKVSAVERAEDAAAPSPERRGPARPRLTVPFYRDDVEIDQAELAKAIDRLLKPKPLPLAA